MPNPVSGTGTSLGQGYGGGWVVYVRRTETQGKRVPGRRETPGGRTIFPGSCLESPGWSLEEPEPTTPPVQVLESTRRGGSWRSQGVFRRRQGSI